MDGLFTEGNKWLFSYLEAYKSSYLVNSLVQANFQTLTMPEEYSTEKLLSLMLASNTRICF